MEKSNIFSFSEPRITGFLDIQHDSFCWFLDKGIPILFTSRFFSKFGCFVYFSPDAYKISPPEYTFQDARERHKTYSLTIRIPAKITAQKMSAFSERGYRNTQTFLRFEIPLVSQNGTFIKNGVERVVVGHFVRCPGVYFLTPDDKHGERIFLAKLIPQRGAWVKIFLEGNAGGATGDNYPELIKIHYRGIKTLPIFFVLRMLGMKTKMIRDQLEHPAYFFQNIWPNSDIRQLDNDIYIAQRIAHILGLSDPRDLDKDRPKIVPLSRYYPRSLRREDLPDARKIWSQKYFPIFSRHHFSPAISTRLQKSLGAQVAHRLGACLPTIEKLPRLPKEKEKKLLSFRDVFIYLRKFLKYMSLSEIKDLNDYRTFMERNCYGRFGICDNDVLDSSDITLISMVQHHLFRIFFDKRKFWYGGYGRKQMDSRLGRKNSISPAYFTSGDFMNIINHLLDFRKGLRRGDEPDHWGNKVLRVSGMLLYEQLKIAYRRFKRLHYARLHDTLFTATGRTRRTKCVHINWLVDSYPFETALHEFFASSPFSQYADQINPLAALYQKRRITACGPGGITHDRVSVAVRSVHPGHNGRVCPLESPDGRRAGLTTALAIYAKVNALGSILVPVYPIDQGRIELNSYPKYLDSLTEEKVNILISSFKINKRGIITNKWVLCRYSRTTRICRPTEARYVKLHRVDICSIGILLAPFVEHNDATRARMASKMQGQAVPLVFPSRPLVQSMYDRELMDVLDTSIDSVGCGQVLTVTPREIIVLDSRRIILKYSILRYDSSNQGTCYDLRPLVRPDEKVWLGQCLAIGPTADWLRGAPSGISRTPVSEPRTLALGRNVTLAYSTWDGYNFEDGILINEEFVHSGVYNSVLIKTLSIAITKTDVLDKSYLELPASVIDHLDKYAIVKLGTLTVKGLILVGRMTLRKYRAKGLAARQKEASDGAERLIRTLLGQDAVPNYTLNPLRAKSKEAGRVVNKNILTTANNSASGMRIEIQIGFIRTLQLGDKFCGRYGNKGVIASIATFEEMAHYGNGIPLDMLLNPLGVPSRLNMSQVYESALGFEFCRKSVFNSDADEYRPEGFIVPAFDEEIANYESSQEPRGSALISTYRLSVQQKIDNKFDNRPLTGVTEFLLNEPYVSCGYPGSPFLTGDQYRVRLHDAGTPTSGDCALGTGYMLKLIHLADDKFHVRDDGPYSSLTQQPTQGKSSDGGQRLGEMEVWAFEAWGAYYNLWELFTIKSDEIQGRRHIPTALLEGFGTTEYLFEDAPLAGAFIINPENVLPGTPGVPETFRLFVRELQSLCLDLFAFRSPTANNKNQEQINLFDFPLSTTDPFRPPEPKYTWIPW